MRHTLAVLVENHPGVLSRVAGLFARRGYNIESLVVGETEDKTVSRITLVVEGDEKVIEQVSKQLNKQVDVIKVNDITNEETVERQLLLLKVAADPPVRQEIMQIVEIFRCRIVDIGRRSLIIEATGDEEKIQAIIKSLQPFGIQELVRTGKVAMVRGQK
ncbi:MAG: acetolactate synthase small subunit [Bacillota bacterium]|jgi:acetolactate synthase-1/3 small subunit|uniref:Acetolactate synthase small subunit n=1 Tax=Thermanaerosceptrum fracticalcis TaxID=1712410 RepID=A0A7G6E3I2_THEFR|nr:acetolactate synthase small subunit [Thermanaerosceptrum fracticalcis]MBZ4653426.1 acetolactate synthase, small subunit [Peptococcaceae bacterium]QNB46636.1 acetolactate synthase small subunit [Thermanaerosceptrum fracticalcis]